MSYLLVAPIDGVRTMRADRLCDVCGKVLLSDENKYVDLIIKRGNLEREEYKHLCLDCYEKLLGKELER